MFSSSGVTTHVCEIDLLPACNQLNSLHVLNDFLNSNLSWVELDASAKVEKYGEEEYATVTPCNLFYKMLPS